jgi:hypothetical protein
MLGYALVARAGQGNTQDYDSAFVWDFDMRETNRNKNATVAYFCVTHTTARVDQVNVIK